MAEKHMRGTGVTYTAAVETACDSHKTEHTPTTQASLHTPWRSPKWAGNSCAHRNLPSSFVAALFTAVKTCKQPRCPSVGQRINKLGSIQTMGIIQLKRNELSSNRKTWRDLTTTCKGWRWSGSSSMTFCNRQNYGESKSTSGSQGLGEGRMSKRSTEGL